MICPIVMNPTSLASELYDALYSFAASLTFILTDYPSSWMPMEHLFLREGLRCPVGIGFTVFRRWRCLVGRLPLYCFGAPTVNVSMMFYVLSQCLGDPRARVSAILGCGASRVPAFFLELPSPMAIHASG